jgi:hypothetical protein
VATALLLDEMLSGSIAEQLRARGHDAVAVVERDELIGASDKDILATATAENRALVTLNVRHFVLLDQGYRAVGRNHAGLVLVSTKTFPPSPGTTGALVRALLKLLAADGVASDSVVFLQP